MITGLTSGRSRRAVVALATVALVAASGGAAQAAGKGKAVKSRGGDHRAIAGDYNGGKALRFSAKASGSGGAQEGGAVVGTVRQWPALDDELGVIYTKRYVLRGVGDNIEIWVAENLAYPAGDCRNTVDGGAPITVTDAQVASFIDEFDSNMYPKESQVFSVPPPRDGSNTPLKKAYTKYYGLPNRSYQGHGDRIVTLIDNVRDSNFYRPTDPDGKTYIAGFFYSVFNEMTNRNVMSIDSFDWLHRTGTFESQPDDTNTPDYAACSAEIGRTFGDRRGSDYEGTFAHEYQHLLEYYEDRDEVNWVNEGISDWAQTLTGYVNPKLDPTNARADSHIATFLGFNTQNGGLFGGPEQSMTRWGDQGAPEILSDYGAAYTFMEYLWSHFGGDSFMTALHREDAGGLPGLQKVLDAKVAAKPKAQDVIHDWLASMALDAAIEDGATPTAGSGPAAALSTSSMRGRINWSNPQAYASPGAPTNGADFVPLASATATTTFDGAASYTAQPVEWTADGNRLYSGKGDDLDRAIARQVTVPAANPTVSVGLQYDTEPAWDFAFVQIYDATAKKWVSLSNENTTSAADPGADPLVVANLPGFTGTAGPSVQTFTVPSAYTGSPVWLAVRYITDASVQGDGVWLDSLAVGGQAVAGANTLAGWTSLTGAVPVPVSGWTVQVVGISGTQVGRAILPLTTNGNRVQSAPFTAAGLLGFTPTQTGVIVTADDPTETVADYAPYTLTSGGLVLPGGGEGAAG